MLKEHILIVAEGCPGCAEAEAKFKDRPEVKIRDVMKDDLAADIVRSLGITALPTVVEFDRANRTACILNDRFQRRCSRVVEGNGQ